jgi:ABC-type multidrug transport system fused ATPase/permease subunit
MMMLTLGVGLVLSATQWVPSLELLSYSNRKIVGAEMGYVYLPPWYALTLVFPNLFGEAYDARILKLFTALGVSHDHILYLGIAALAPLGFALYWLWNSRRKDDHGLLDQMTSQEEEARRRAIFFAMLAALSLVLMMAAPLYVHVTRFIPILQVIRVAVRAGVLFLFAGTVLVSIGTDLLLNSGRETHRRFFQLTRRFVVAITGFIVIAVAGSYLIKVFGIAADPDERGRWAFVRKTAVALSGQFTPPDLSIIIPLAFLAIVTLLLWAFSENRISSRMFVLSIVVLLMVDLFWNSNQFDHTFDRSRVFPRTEVTDLLQQLPPGRVLVAPAELETNRSETAGAEKIIAPPNTLLPYRISSVTGKNQQFPRWYREFASLIEPQTNLSHVVFDQYRSPFFDILNVKYVMTRDPLPPVDGYSMLRESEGVIVYENRNALPRTYFARDVVEVRNSAESLDKMRSPDFRPASQTVVESDENSSPSFAANLHANTTSQAPVATIIADKRNSLSIETDNSQDGLLVLSDNYYPGWRATVDGAPARILRANHTMRAIAVPAGRHLVSFVFMPAAFLLSVYVSITAATITLVFLGVSVLKRRQGHDIRQDKKDS